MSFCPVKEGGIQCATTLWLLLETVASLRNSLNDRSYSKLLLEKIEPGVIGKQDHNFVPGDVNHSPLSLLQLICCVQLLDRVDNEEASFASRLVTETDAKAIQAWKIYPITSPSSQHYPEYCPLISCMLRYLVMHDESSANPPIREVSVFHRLIAEYPQGFPTLSGHDQHAVIFQYITFAHFYKKVYQDSSLLDKFMSAIDLGTLKTLKLPNRGSKPECFNYPTEADVDYLLQVYHLDEQYSYVDFFHEALSSFLRVLIYRRMDIISLENFADDLPDIYKRDVSRALLARSPCASVLVKMRLFIGCTQGNTTTSAKRNCSP